MTGSSDGTAPIKGWDSYALWWNVFMCRRILNEVALRLVEIFGNVKNLHKHFRGRIFVITVERSKQTNSVASSPQANYTDWSTITGRRILMPTFADRLVSRGQRGGTPAAVSLSFLNWSCCFFFQVAPHVSSRGSVDPVPDPLLLRKYGSPGYRTWDL
jgi:hypothetical protein